MMSQHVKCGRLNYGHRGVRSFPSTGQGGLGSQEVKFREILLENLKNLQPKRGAGGQDPSDSLPLCKPYS